MRAAMPRASSSNLFALHHPDADDFDDKEDEEEEDVEDLLYSAQMDFISHRNGHAIAKLQQAVNKGSSAACATLGNLLSRGFRNGPKSPDTPVFGSQGRGSSYMTARHGSTAAAANPNPDRDGLAAARLFVLGLEIELAKPAEPRRRQRSAVTIKKNYGVSGSASSGTETDEDGAEGTHFDLERALDLVIGLTDSYRFGVLQPGDSSNAERDSSASLWERGAEVSERALLHPALIEPPSPTSTPSESPRSTHPAHFTLSPQRTGSPIRSPPARSYAHPSTAIAETTTYQHSTHVQNLTHTVKLRHTIQIHLYYLLALQKWPTDRPLAEKYWTEIILVAAATGGVVGTKEGNEIVQKATQRLHVLSPMPDDSWKLAKHRKHSMSSHSSAPLPFQRALSSRKFNSNEGGSGDALVDMWREKFIDHAPSISGKGKEMAAPDSDVDASSITVRQAPRAIPQPSGLSWSSSSPTEPAASPRLSSSKPTFHFATVADYPSPPASPPDSPPLASPVDSIGSVPSPLASDSPPTEDTSPKPPSPLKMGHRPGLRRLPSTASFQPPGLPRLLKRVESSTSVSTLPPDFFSAKAHHLGMRFSTQPLVSSSLAHRSVDALEAEATRPPLPWTSSFKQRLSNLRSSSTRVIATLNPFKVELKPASAVQALSSILRQDDLSAGPGMYWADPEQLEDEAEAEEPPPELIPNVVATAPSSGRSSPSTGSASKVAPSKPTLRPARSFIDPTSSPSLTRNVSFHCPPAITTTPPTPEKAGENVAAARSSRRLGKGVDIDPLLLELERKSRVGVKTTCATCGKKGLNFPTCPRCKTTYCSRPCRISVDGAGDGIRHICPAKSLVPPAAVEKSTITLST